MNFIHYICLKKWITVQRKQQVLQNLISYYWKKFECEICKTFYPYLFKSKGKYYPLVDFERPEGNYIILESLTMDKNSSRMIHVIRANEDKNSFKMGRGHEADIRISDISVSRTHAILKYVNGGFYLEDNMSKFGTLVRIHDSQVDMVENSTKAI